MSTKNGTDIGCTCDPGGEKCRWCRRMDARLAALRPAPEPPPAPELPQKCLERIAEAPQLLTVQAVSRLTMIGVRTIWRLVEQGRFPPPLRWSRKLIRWKRTVVLAWLEGLNPDAPPAA